MALTAIQKKLIEDECAAVLERYKDALREVEVYKWLARLFFTLVLGGSIVGFIQLQSYLDERIAKGTANLERLFLSKALIDSFQYKDALPELMEFARSVSSVKLPESVSAVSDRNLFGDFDKAGPSVRSYFFLSALDTLSGIATADDESASHGRIEWSELLKNTKFRADIVHNPRWSNDPRVLNRLATGTIKFAANEEEIKRSKFLFEKQRQYAQTSSDRATSSFALGIFYLSSNDITGSSREFSAANLAIPRWVKDTDEYFATPDVFYWAKLFSSLDEFRKRYDAVIKAMNAPPV